MEGSNHCRDPPTPTAKEYMKKAQNSESVLWYINGRTAKEFLLSA